MMGDHGQMHTKQGVLETTRNTVHTKHPDKHLECSELVDLLFSQLLSLIPFDNLANV
jgi:hypothetical protein